MRRSLSLFTIALLGCFDSTAPELEALLRAREKWRAQAPADYDFTYEQAYYECAEVPSWAIKVRGGRAVDIVRTETPCFGSAPVKTTVEVDPTRSMYWIFDFALKEQSESDYVKFEFDPALGFPRRMFVDRRRDLVDEEFVLSVSISKLGK